MSELGWTDAFRSFLTNHELSDEELEVALIDELDAALGRPERQTVSAGTVLLRSGDAVDVIRIVVAGSVRLSLPVDDELTTFHSRTAGRIIGSMSIPYGAPAFYTVTAKTDLTYMELTIEELDAALEAHPALTAHFVSVLLRSMARRNRRSAELQIENRELAASLAEEKDRLQLTLDELRRTQGRLIESEKLAILGQLAAGIGHELNNPTAAAGRAAAYVRADVEAIALAKPGGADLVAMLESAYKPALRSTADERAARRTLAAEIKDDALAARLVRIGIFDSEHFERALADSVDRDARLAELENHYRLGSSLRTITSSAERIAALVRGVKAYARTDARWLDGLDIHEGIEESLLLLGHETQGVMIEREYTRVPPISGVPGELNQVWTNLLSNALQAMEPGGTLRIETDTSATGSVEVRVIDTGHGIAAENLERIFEPSFTTREGHVEFGLGLGLQITRDLVHRHGGTIKVESRPGRTCFTVVLPTGDSGLSGDATSTREGEGTS